MQGVSESHEGSAKRTTCCTALHVIIRSILGDDSELSGPHGIGEECYNALQPISKSSKELLVTRVCAHGMLYIIASRQDRRDAGNDEVALKHMRMLLKLALGATAADRALRVAAVTVTPGSPPRFNALAQAQAGSIIDEAAHVVKSIMQHYKTRNCTDAIKANQAIMSASVPGTGLPDDEQQLVMSAGKTLAEQLPPGIACDACRATADSLLKCQRCGLFWFCSKACLKADWKKHACGHKAMCRAPADMQAGDAVVVAGSAASFGPLDLVVAPEGSATDTWLVTSRAHMCERGHAERPILCKRVHVRHMTKNVRAMRSDAAVNNIMGVHITAQTMQSVVGASQYHICE